MIINNPGAEFSYEGIEYIIGSPVVATAESEYAGLYGHITEIRYGGDKETENETLDIYCEFDPPVLPKEIKELEQTFSELYHEPKTLDDISLDRVIMAPEMICQLEDLHTVRKKVPIYLVVEDWAVNGEHGNSCELFSDYDDAKRIMIEMLQKELEGGSIQDWKCFEEFRVVTSKNSYEAYLDGEYMENHYAVSVKKQPVTLSARSIHEVSDIYMAKCWTKDFVSQIEGWDAVEKLSDAQYQKLISDPSIPDRIGRQLDCNDGYWESFWESVSEVGFELVKEYADANDGDALSMEGGDHHE